MSLELSGGRPTPVENEQRPAAPNLLQRTFWVFVVLQSVYLFAGWFWLGLTGGSRTLLTIGGAITLLILLRCALHPSSPEPRLAVAASSALLGNALLGLYLSDVSPASSFALGIACLSSGMILPSRRWMLAAGSCALGCWMLAGWAQQAAVEPLALWLGPGLILGAQIIHSTRMELESSSRILQRRVQQLEAENKAWNQNRGSQAKEAARVLKKRGETEGLWDWDLRTDEISFSPRWASMLGYSLEEIGGSPESWFNLIHPHDLGRTLERLTAHLEGREATFECEHRIRLRDGAYAWVLSRGQALLGENGEAERILGSQIHLGRLKSVESKLLRDATYDRLTGLPNRHYLLARLREDFARATRNDRYGFAVVFLDLDGFKDVNDSLGHLVGDRFLGMVGRRLAEAKRREDTVARLGGDEFVMILRNLRDEADAVLLASRIQEALAEPFLVVDQELVTGSSVGIAMYTREIARTEDLLRNADIAMYHAKGSRKGGIQIFDAEMHVRTRRLWNLQTDLRRAIDRRQLQLMYQPIVELRSGRICCAEALIRWRRDDGELVSPSEFIPLAEEQGLIGSIGEWALREACFQNKSWQNAGLRPIRISVNLSTKQLSNHEFAAAVRKILEETGLEPRWLQLELTETALMGSLDATPASLYSLFCMDIRLAIDDFGTGYSSLEYLRKLQFDTLKIDKSFVEEIGSDHRSAALAHSIISMAHSLRMSSLAEGVETVEQLELLRSYGCGMVQGYLASRPIAAEVLGDLLRADARLLDRALVDPSPACREHTANPTVPALAPDAASAAG